MLVGLQFHGLMTLVIEYHYCSYKVSREVYGVAAANEIN